MWETVSALCVVLGLILLLGALLRRVGLTDSSTSRDRLRIVETVSLGGRQRLHVVEVRGESLLLGSSEKEVKLLRSLPECHVGEEDSVTADESVAPRHENVPMLDRIREISRVAFLFLLLFSLGVAALSGSPAMAAEGIDIGPARLTLALDEAAAPGQISSTMQIVALLTLLSVAPSILLMMTCYVRILIVLTLLRQAMGTHQLPPKQVLVSLALFTTFFVMAPVGEEIYENAMLPYSEEKIGFSEAAEKAQGPVREYLLHHTRQADLGLFIDLAGADIPESREDVGFRMLLPAYMISEIRTAFEIGFMIYLPFLIIDILVASMLISMGMMVLPPMMISLPFKLMLFVLLDGWNLLINALVSGLQ